MSSAPVGRPSIYTPELGAEIAMRAIMRPLYQVCKDEDMPSRDAVYQWLSKHKEFADNYARAREIRAYRRNEDIDEIMADMKAGDVDAAQARVMLDAIKWQAGKEAPKVFGDKLDLNHGGNLTIELVSFGDDQNPKP